MVESSTWPARPALPGGLVIATLLLAPPGAAAEVSAGAQAGNLSQIVLALGAVIVAILALAWIAKRLLRLPSAASGPLRVIGGVSMGAREKVVLMQVGDTQILLGVAPGRIQTLHVLPEPIAGLGSSGGFAEHLGVGAGRRGWLGRLRERGDAGTDPDGRRSAERGDRHGGAA